MNIREPDLQELPTSRQLLMASIVAVLMAVLLLLAIVLPAETGLDVTGVGERLHLTRMGQIKSAMSEQVAPTEGRPIRQDEINITLPAGQGMEVKLEMNKGFLVEYSWTATGGKVEHDTHGDPYVNKQIYITYTSAVEVDSDSGSIEAVYSGLHGWYWKNNGNDAVMITLKTNGQYFDLIPM